MTISCNLQQLLSGQRDKEDFRTDFEEIGKLLLAQYTFLVHALDQAREGTVKRLTCVPSFLRCGSAHSFQHLTWYQQFISKFIGLDLQRFMVYVHILGRMVNVDLKPELLDIGLPIKVSCW